MIKDLCNLPKESGVRERKVYCLTKWSRLLHYQPCPSHLREGPADNGRAEELYLQLDITENDYVIKTLRI